ncbi:hypothetical protein DFH11DRAFT_1879703 [Phellopilus nigrolimitatus]|nr:hypothetical protein DFH11DRAFT_1879703 [Phellopilus nigrolimitatus]
MSNSVNHQYNADILFSVTNELPRLHAYAEPARSRLSEGRSDGLLRERYNKTHVALSSSVRTLPDTERYFPPDCLFIVLESTIMEYSTPSSIPKARAYQLEMLNASLQKNIVIAMDTGSGKTHIAILRMKTEAEREPRKISWFLAPTVGLCEQQRDVVRACLPVPVGLISGALEPNQWTDPQLWKDALSTHRIIVSTPQVLLDALRHGYINLGCDIGLLIFDEAHHATDKHPYNMIMREFYDMCKPRTGTLVCSSHEDTRPLVLGLTASPIFGRNVNRAFEKIECNLDSIILGPRRTRNELTKHVHRPVFKYILYPPLSDALDPLDNAKNVFALSTVVKALDIQKDPTVLALRHELAKAANPADAKRIDQLLSHAVDRGDTFVHKGMRDFLRTAKELCADLGPWAANWYVISVVNKALKGGADALHLFSERDHNEKAYLQNILRSIELIEVSYDPSDIVRACSSKANELIACLLREKEDSEACGEAYSGIVFVTRRDGVLALSEVLANHPLTRDVFTTGVLLGGSESTKRKAFLDITRMLLTQKQRDVLAEFRIGEKNLVVSTAVAEEGIDIQACGNVIRWDLPQNMVSWAQSRGRARRKQSSFVLMFENGGCHSHLIQKWENLEAQMVDAYLDEQRLLKTLVDKEEDEDKGDEHLEFSVPSTRAKVTLHSAISHIAHFCNTLPSTMRPDIQPAYDIEPPDYPIGYHSFSPETKQGANLMRNPGPYGAKLTLPRLIPYDKRIYKTGVVHRTKQAARRHVAYMAYVALYHTGLLNEHLLPLSGSTLPLHDEEIQKVLKAVEIHESSGSVREQMDPWSLLLGSNADGDEDQWWSNKLIIEGVGTVSIVMRRQLPRLDFYSDALPDLYGPRQVVIHPGSKVKLSPKDTMAAKCYTRRLFSVFSGNRLDWNSLDYSYLFLPPEECPVDIWEQRRSWADSVRPNDDDFSARDRPVINANVFGEHYTYPSDISMVMAGLSLYRFQSWRNDKLTMEEKRLVRERYSCFEDLEVTYPLIVAQPLQSQSYVMRSPEHMPVQQANVILIPSLTSVVLDNEVNIMLGLFLPSILRTLFIKLIAVSLQSTILSRASPSRYIPLDLVQTVLMGPSVDAHFGYKRLETLGDAVLKFITSVHLLAEHPNWPEGFLKKRKVHAVSNAYLAQSAIGKRLYNWMIRRIFRVRKYGDEQSLMEKESDLVGDGSVTDAGEDPEVIAGENDCLVEGNESSTKETNALAKLLTKTLAEVIGALIGAVYLSGGFDSSIACADAFDLRIGSAWKPLSTRVSAILARVEPLQDAPIQFSYPESIIGYTFTHKLLLVEALMHASCQSDLPSISYERMQFLGDALLDVLVTDTLFRAGEHNIGSNAGVQCGAYTPRQIHDLKAALVSMHFLAFVCLRAHVVLDASMPRWDVSRALAVRSSGKHNVHLMQCLLHSSGALLDEQRDALARFQRWKEEIERDLEGENTFPWAVLARLQAPKFLSDIVESLVGAVYLDSNGDMDAVRGVLERLGMMSVLRRVVRERVDVRHPVSRVIEWAGKHQLTEQIKWRVTRDGGKISCTLVVEGVELTSATERHNGKASEDDVRCRVAEAGIKMLFDKYGGTDVDEF